LATRINNGCPLTTTGHGGNEEAMTVNVNGGVQMESTGVMGRVGDRFPLTTPLGVVPVDGTPVADGRFTPFGMTARVTPADPVPVDLTGVGYDEMTQTSTWPVHAPSAATSPATSITTTNTTDGARGPDSTPDSASDRGID
jgi:hypothetical protein